jgi:uncharacterized protein DUF2752
MRPRWTAGLLAAASLAAMAVVYNFPPNAYGFYPRCPFYAVTHWLCPGCGATRALYSLLHGDWAGALHHNALFTLLTPLFIAWFAFWSYHAMRYDRFQRLSVPREVLLGAGIAVLLFTVTRNTLLVF